MLKLLRIPAFAFLVVLSLLPAASGRPMNDTRLYVAAANDDAASIRTLLAQGVPVDGRDKGN
ncbi:hypothetical protein NQU49_26125, partial [Escherichia coli]|uniref:hypothetical protein n=1 Tax=Escherichia coli TaxID=562 RepID=UPI0021185659